jgi:phosphoribosyl-AMP cyclohydrolase / phosphoribosyl-ATP pyrophosphohydrolase
MGAPGAEVTLGPGVLVPCVVQDAASGEVLMLAHVDDEALAATRDTGLAHFHSRSRDQLWQKGATSGHTMAVESLAFDCHTGEETCFGPRLIDGRPAVMAELAAVIEDRRARQQGASYVAGILGGEREQAQRKVGEEAVEVLLAAPGSPELVAEVADLWFHSMLLLARDGLDPLAPLEELRRRRQAPR